MNLKEKIEHIERLKKVTAAQEEAHKKDESKAAPEYSLKDLNTMEKLVRNFNGDDSKGRVSVKEAITTTNAIKLIPKVIEGEMREAAEPEYLAVKYMKVIKADPNASGYIYQVPAMSEMTAYELAEGGPYREGALDQNVFEDSMIEIKTKKIGLKVSITEEAIGDSNWDVLGIYARKMGRAMARYKETWCFNNFSDHGWTVFDNDIRKQLPEAGTLGRAADGSYNDTVSVEDFLDMVLAVMTNGFNPTTVIMHPLTWVIFARNSMIGNGLTYGAFGGSQVHPWGATQGTGGFAGLAANQGPQKMIMKPEEVQNRLPVPIEIEFSPFIRFDKQQKKFDMYVIDKNEVGVILQKENMVTGNWTDPERDIRLMKVRERYGVGISNNGRAIAVAKNISVAATYPEPPRVEVITKEN